MELYGGVLQNPWFDRDLAIAGRVHFRNPEGTVQGALVQLPEKLAIIPPQPFTWTGKPTKSAASMRKRTAPRSSP